MSKEIDYILKEMCSYVGADFNTIDFKKNDWYMDYEWSSDDELKFRDWLANEFKNNNKVRKELTTLPDNPRKSRCEETANWFILSYGWKTKIENKEE